MLSILKNLARRLSRLRQGELAEKPMHAYRTNLEGLRILKTAGGFSENV